ncbi:uncharacterized protein LOC126260712 [Schistocerca nitens]|uniref:uncharacterized protein LOC126260712 n=1 Tax=Schistocerca nitens TaxID=7011 RepID=UPI002119B50D|nr:uncharacterized protein LOC126260712 [Schistocerca nitens]
MQATRRVLEAFPRSQHLVIIVEIGLSIPIIKSPPVPRWNLRKADWGKYKSFIDKTINRIPPSPENYQRFVNMIYKGALKAIPRGARREYIPCWSEECESLLEQYERSGVDETAERLINTMNEERRNRWKMAMENLDFTDSSRKSWGLLWKLGGAITPRRSAVDVDPSEIATAMKQTSKIRLKTEEKKRISRNLTKELANNPTNLDIVKAVDVEEITQALTLMKTGKAAGPDEILPEFLRELGPIGRKWMAKLFTECIKSGALPKLWKEAKAGNEAGGSCVLARFVGAVSLNMDQWRDTKAAAATRSARHLPAKPD